MYPIVKTVYLVRHAESAYNAFMRNAVNWLTLRALKDPKLYDARVSPKGLLQLEALTTKVKALNFLSMIDCIVTSPLRRAIDTALAIRKGKPSNASEETSDKPLLVCGYCAEIMDTTADVGSTNEELSENYPSIDFSNLVQPFWYVPEGLSKQPDVIVDEPRDVLSNRIQKFNQYICSLPQERIAVVTHSLFIRKVTGSLLKIGNCDIQLCQVTQHDENTFTWTVQQARVN